MNMDDKANKSDKVTAEEVRAKRNELLHETDWTQLKDIYDIVGYKWALYRQELRDVPQQPGFPYNIDWPTKPE